jgi:DNA-directed RNA polymerase specialized sigma subunit
MARKPRWKHELEKADPRHDLEPPAPDWVIQTHHKVQPETELEALMMTAPGEHTPEIVPKDVDTYEALDQILGVKLELNDVERSVLDALFVSGLSIRDAADVLGTSPSTVWRIKESALARIRHRAEWDTIGEPDE